MVANERVHMAEHEFPVFSLRPKPSGVTFFPLLILLITEKLHMPAKYWGWGAWLGGRVKALF